jgi:hypothetical protein
MTDNDDMHLRAIVAVADAVVAMDMGQWLACLDNRDAEIVRRVMMALYMRGFCDALRRPTCSTN